jgi:hypothetical protein
MAGLPPSETQYLVIEWPLLIAVVTHPFGIGFSILIAPGDSIYEASFHLGWVSIEFIL